jgi:uncharacterized phage protein (TIGR02216 family)
MPWRQLLGAAMALGLSPAAFWRLSLREWRALVAPSAPSMTRGGFEALSKRFPDQ